MTAKTDSPSTAAAAPPKKEGRRLYDHPAFRTWGLAALLLSFMIMSLDYLRANLWMDELITLNSFVNNPEVGFTEVFSQYRVANNHILYSALMWIWVRVVGMGSEEILRFPGLLMGAVSLVLLYHMGRRLFDRASGFFLALLMGFSPIFLAFVCQMRGYGMTFLLATLATYGALLVAGDKARQGLLLFVPAALLLPGVLPSNLLLSATLVGYMALVARRRRRLARQSGALALAALAAAGGMALYLPILEELLQVMDNTVGWPNGWIVVGNWVTALALHLGAFTLAAIGFGQAWRREHPEPQDEHPGDRARELLPLLALCCGVVLIGFSLWRAPFPRSLLAFLPPLTVCSLYVFRQSYVERNINFMLLGFFVLCNTLAATRLGDYFTRRDLAAGQIPQSLVQQFYARQSDVTDVVAALMRADGVRDRAIIFADFRTYMPLELYWTAAGGDPTQLECYEQNTMILLRNHPGDYLHYPQIILAYNPDRARALYRERLGIDAELELIDDSSDLRIYAVHPIIPRPGYLQPPGPGAPTPPPSDDPAPARPSPPAGPGSPVETL